MTTSHLLGTENPMPERPREKEEPAVRETSEAVDCHLGDMLQQLHSVNASKPSERGLVRQGGHCSRLGRGCSRHRERPGSLSLQSVGLGQAPVLIICPVPSFPVD